MNNNASVSAENFIKTIYHFENREGLDTRTGSIAKELGITHAAVTDMARKLSDRKLINYKKYKELRLTPAGKKLALGVIRKHRLWETFLHKVLGLSMHEIHREAEALEHSSSDFLMDKINAYLGNPATDPHGDPIPDADGEFVTDHVSVILSSATAGKKYTITRLSGSDSEFFEFCNANNIKVGSVLTVKKQYSKNRMTEIETGKANVLLNSELANSVYVKEN